MHSSQAREPAKATLAQLQAMQKDTFADWVHQLDLRLVQAHLGQVELVLPVAPPMVHVGRVLCGQAMMAAADTAMGLAIASQMGEFRPCTTVQMQTSFLRPIAGDSGEVRVLARVLRMGRSLVFGEVEIFDAKGTLAAHTTATWAFV